MFNPASFFSGPTRQTVLGGYVKSAVAINSKRVRYETPDDDFIDIDYFDFELTEEQKKAKNSVDNIPIVILLHGLGGSTSSGYIRLMATELRDRGIRAAGMNMRGSTGPNRQPRLYYAGDIYDIGFIVDCVIKDNPKAKIGLCGFSLGAAITLNYMCHNCSVMSENVKLAVAVSPPLDLTKNAVALASGTGKKWTSYLLRGLRELVTPLRPVLETHPKVDMDKVMNCQTIREFDDCLTCPLHGFENSAIYYEQCSPGPKLDKIAHPTLIIKSSDDPFFSPDDCEWPQMTTNKYITPMITDYGGHVGFIERKGLKFAAWAEGQAADWCAQHFFPNLEQKKENNSVDTAIAATTPS